jgi:hypothetical protein
VDWFYGSLCFGGPIYAFFLLIYTKLIAQPTSGYIGTNSRWNFITAYAVLGTSAILIVSWKVHRVEVREFVHNFRLERERSQQEKILNALPMRVLVVSKK